MPSLELPAVDACFDVAASRYKLRRALQKTIRERAGSSLAAGLESFEIVVLSVHQTE